MKRPHKRDQPKWVSVQMQRDSIYRTLNFEKRNRQTSTTDFNQTTSVDINGELLSEKISICLPKRVSTRHTSNLKRPCFTSTTTAGKGTSYSGFLSKWLILMLCRHLTITNVQVLHKNWERKFQFTSVLINLLITGVDATPP